MKKTLWDNGHITFLQDGKDVICVCDDVVDYYDFSTTEGRAELLRKITRLNERGDVTLWYSDIVGQIADWNKNI